MTEITQEHIIDQLKDLGYDPKIQKESGQIYLLFQHEKYEFPLFIRILHDGELLQIVAFIPFSFAPEHLNDLCRFLLMVNRELDMPGLCLDETSKAVFYRLVLPSFSGEIPSDLLATFLNATQNVCKTFYQAIGAIGNGLMSLDAVLKKTKRQVQQ
jgi:hypothetical protein